MNRDKYLENIEIKNRRLLLKIYKKHIEKLKIQIFEATEKGNSTVYLENLRLQVEKQIAQFEKDLKQYSASAVKTSYESGAKTAVVGELAKEIAGDYVFGTANNEAMRTLAQTTYEPLSKMAQQIGRATLEYMKRENFKDTQTVLKALGKFVDSNYLRKVGIEGVGNVVVGSETWQTAARKIRDKIISEANIKVPYYNKKGDVIRFVHAQDYAKMVSRTTTANVFREGAKDRILDTFGDDGDLVEIIGKSIFPDSPCIPYQGKILSLEGQTKGYTTIKEAKANGLFHPNCIHNFAVTDKVMAIYDKMEDKANEPKEKTQAQPFNSNNTSDSVEDMLKDVSNTKDKEIQEILKHVNKLPDVNISKGSDLGKFNPDNYTIKVPDSQTLTHEIGHWLDFGLIKLKNDNGLPFSYNIEKVLVNHQYLSAEKLPLGVINKLQQVKGIVDNNGLPLFETQRVWNEISDIYDALTKGDLYTKGLAPFGHGIEYYKDIANQTTELFAQYFSLRVYNKQEQIEFLKKYSPKLVEILEKQLTNYLEEIKNI